MKKILLIQFIEEKEFRKNEVEKYKSIFEQLNLKNIKLDTINPFENKIKIENIKKYDRIILGGSNLSFEGLKKNDWKKIELILKKTRKLIPSLIKLNVPTLAICFGHQLTAYIHGTDIKNQPRKAKSGSYEISPLVKEDIIFKGIPGSFNANYMHHDSLTSIPGRSTLIANGDKCDFAMLKYGKNFYSTQFHPELSNKRLKNILSLRTEYIPKNKKINDIFKSTKESHLILKTFIEENL